MLPELASFPGLRVSLGTRLYLHEVRHLRFRAQISVPGGEQRALGDTVYAVTVSNLRKGRVI